MNPDASEYEKSHEKTQSALLEFMEVELQSGKVFVHTAKLAGNEGHSDHAAQAKGNAVKAAEAIRRFAGQIQDGAKRSEIEMGLAELEQLIAALVVAPRFVGDR